VKSRKGDLSNAGITRVLEFRETLLEEKEEVRKYADIRVLLLL